MYRGLITLNIVQEEASSTCSVISKVLARNCETLSDRDLRKISSLTTGIGTYDRLIAKMKMCPREYAKDRSEVRRCSQPSFQRSVHLLPSQQIATSEVHVNNKGGY
jgi:hypothetical protein